MKKIAPAVVLMLLLCASLGFAGRWLWNDGFATGKAVTHEAILQGEAQNSATKAADAQQEAKTITEYVEVERIVYRDGQTIIKKVPEYVTVEADSNCTVPMGFVSLHDHAIRAANMAEEDATSDTDPGSATAGDDLPVPEWADFPAGVPLSKIEEISIQNATAYRILKARHAKLAQWAQTQCYGPP